MVARALPRINVARIKQFAAYAKTAVSTPPLNFYSFPMRDGSETIASDMYPPLHANGVIDFFFFAMLHNYGFWHDNGREYTGPLYGTFGGKTGVKGSDLLWKILCAAWKKDAECFSPSRLAVISDEDFSAIFSDDNGPIPLFHMKKRIALTREYGNWFHVRRLAGRSPSDLMLYTSECADPVGVARAIIMDPENGISGFHNDPLGKKAELLLMALVNRPEKLLRETKMTEWHPIVDYHDMRLTLRMGQVILPKEWREENSGRLITTPEREEAIRRATHKADMLAIKESGRTMAEIDNLKWSARRYCPEMETPNCSKCSLQGVCAQKTELFQPVLRTTYY